MKGCIVYSSLSGRTKKLAYGLYEALKEEYCLTIKERKEEMDLSPYDTIFLGFWAYKGGNDPSLDFIFPRLKGKDVYVFGTLGYFDDSPHAYRTRQAVVEKVKACGGRVIGSFITTGGIPEKRIEEKIRKRAQSKRPLTEERLVRYRLTADYPTEVDIAALAQRVDLNLKILEETGGKL